MVLAASLAGVLLLAWRVDINEFSLNEFYRNRLVRCYLGATRRSERAQAPELHRLRREGRHAARRAAAHGGEEAGRTVAHHQLRAQPGRLRRPVAAHPALRVVHPDAVCDRVRLPVATQKRRYRRRPNDGSDTTDEDGARLPQDCRCEPRHPTLGAGRFRIGRRGEPQHGLPHLAGGRVPADGVQRSASAGGSRPRASRDALRRRAFSLRYLFMELFGIADDRVEFPDDFRRRPLREPGRLRADQAQVPRGHHQRRRVRSQAAVRGARNADTHGRGRFRRPDQDRRASRSGPIAGVAVEQQPLRGRAASCYDPRRSAERGRAGLPEGLDDRPRGLRRSSSTRPRIPRSRTSLPATSSTARTSSRATATSGREIAERTFAPVARSRSTKGRSRSRPTPSWPRIGDRLLAVFHAAAHRRGPVYRA